MHSQRSNQQNGKTLSSTTLAAQLPNLKSINTSMNRSTTFNFLLKSTRAVLILTTFLISVTHLFVQQNLLIFVHSSYLLHLFVAIILERGFLLVMYGRRDCVDLLVVSVNYKNCKTYQNITNFD